MCNQTHTSQSIRTALLIVILFISFSASHLFADNQITASAGIKPFRIALFYPREAPFWNTFVNLMQAAADDLNIELMTYSANGNRFLMKQQFMSVLKGKNKVDAVVFNNYKDSGSQFIKLANEAKVFAFLVNSAMSDDKREEMGKPRQKFPYWIGQMYPDEVGANKKIIDILITKAQEQTPKKRVNVIGINGPISSGAAIMRLNALKEALAEHSQARLLQVVNAENWSEKEAGKRFQALMKRYQGTQVVWAGSARLVDGILNREKALALKAGQDYFTGGIGFKKSMLEAINSNRVSACAGGHYIEGAWALVLIYDYLNGHDFALHGVELQTEMGLVTKENVGMYMDSLTEEKWTKENLSKINFKQYSKTYNSNLLNYNFDFDSIILQLY